MWLCTVGVSSLVSHVSQVYDDEEDTGAVPQDQHSVCVCVCCCSTQLPVCNNDLRVLSHCSGSLEQTVSREYVALYLKMADTARMQVMSCVTNHVSSRYFINFMQGNYSVAKKYLTLTDNAIKSVCLCVCVCVCVCVCISTSIFIQHFTDDGHLALWSLHSAARLVIQQVSVDTSPTHCDNLLNLISKLSEFKFSAVRTVLCTGV